MSAELISRGDFTPFLEVVEG